MNSKLLVTVWALCLSLTNANDIRIGVTSGRPIKIYSEIKEANPAIWTRSEDVVVNSTGNEIIEAIYVTDLREDKDGKAIIENGGVGTRSVTIRLESPSIFRGYKFMIEVYATDPNERYRSKGYSQQYYGDTQFARKF
ncbi:unnamed protein product [Arctia plantaginis]|uniref:Uncharacterized protein n=1 Tax=Arctia plantaginis TaxID=874455 RepID=A0A8S0ZX86_ARCPL|nr:unnamed protein product [Arctia plantaginis]CAB3237876.1 unnamed protein product [Arctia plantaginis]